MGCCFSDENSESAEHDANERNRLLGDVPSERYSSRPNYESGATVTHPKTDETSALNKILTTTASNVIDVAQLESQQMEQHEYMDRARQYSSRLAQQCSGSLSLRNRCTVHLPTGVTAPHTVLSAPPVSSSDITLITNAVTQASRIVKEIKVKHKEELVVPFGVP